MSKCVRVGVLQRCLERRWRELARLGLAALCRAASSHATPTGQGCLSSKGRAYLYFYSCFVSQLPRLIFLSIALLTTGSEGNHYRFSPRVENLSRALQDPPKGRDGSRGHRRYSSLPSSPSCAVQPTQSSVVLQNAFLGATSQSTFFAPVSGPGSITRHSSWHHAVLPLSIAYVLLIVSRLHDGARQR